MDVKKREISPIYFGFLSIFAIINTIMLVRFLMSIPLYKILVQETLWSFLLSTIYITSIFISDANLFLFKSTSLEKFNSFIRNYYSVIVYPYNYNITLEYWLILVVGLILGNNPFYEKSKVTTIIILESLYLHLAICIILIIDLLCTKRKMSNNKTLSLIINFIFFWYCVAVLSSNYIFFMPAYPFMKDAGILLMVIIFIISLALINFCHYLHIFLVRKINRDYEISIKKIE